MDETTLMLDSTTIKVHQHASGAKKEERGAIVLIPSRITARNPRGTDWHTYKERHLIESFFLKLKNNRRFATRYEKEALFSTPLSVLPVSLFAYFDGFKTDSSRGYPCLYINSQASGRQVIHKK